MKAKWIGTSGSLPANADVEILAFDANEAGGHDACWVKYHPMGDGGPEYRTCRQSELVVIWGTEFGEKLINPYIDPPKPITLPG